MVTILLSGIVNALTVSELLSKQRDAHYDGYPTSFTGFVNQNEVGKSTSETMGYYAMSECSEGDINNCKKILQWVDTNVWDKSGSDNTFGWSFYKSSVIDRESATDGDLLLIWSAAKAYKRSNDAAFLTLYNKWKPNIQRLDFCTLSGRYAVASGTGIGRWNGCNSYNGVYAAYILPSLLYDLKQFDSSWSSRYDGAITQMNDMFTKNGVFPPRCGAYDGTNLDASKCELNPNYCDIFDAQRAIFWTGSLCKKDSTPAICNHIKVLVNTYVQSGFSTAMGGYETNGNARGSIQFWEYNAAIWSSAIEYTNSKGSDVINLIGNKWSGSDFYGTNEGLDAFKDMHILLAMIEQEGQLSFSSPTVQCQYTWDIPPCDTYTSSEYGLFLQEWRDFKATRSEFTMVTNRFYLS